ncbi:MAG: sulfatase-like hydrolase/transferase [Cyclobacteriaceae bacterium]
MLIRSIIKVFIIFFLVLIFNNAITQVSDNRPNIIFVMTDDQGYGDVGFMGNSGIITPNLDEMSRAGLRLDRFYTAPICSPTRASVLTGRYPTRAGVFTWGHALRPEEQSLAKFLKTSGYQTGFFGKYHLGSVREEGATSPTAHGFESWYAAANFYENDPWMSKNGVPVQLKGESSDITVELAIDYIQGAIKKDGPFLVFIWLGSPHLPHEAEDYLKNLYPSQPENMKHYLGEMTGIDLAVGKLRQELRNMDIEKETLLWFSSDNGGKFPEGNNGILRDQKGTLYEGGIRVPAIIEWPGKIKPAVSNVPTATVDIFPTLLELAEVKNEIISYPLDGESLVPLMEGKMYKRSRPLGFWVYREIQGNGMKSDQIIQEYQMVLDGKMPLDSLNEGLLNPPHLNYVGLDQYPYSGSFAWIDEAWKLHQNGSDFELYHLEKDPKEEMNLVEQFPERVKSMKEALYNWQNSVIQSIRGEDY